MFSTDIQIRVRYGETDQMRVVYYGNYPLYFEVARTEALRQLGLLYLDMETAGIAMPVTEMYVKYIASAKYDDLLTVRVMIKEKPLVRIHFEYEVYNQDNLLLTEASTKLVFVRKSDFKPIAAPKKFLETLEPFFT